MDTPRKPDRMPPEDWDLLFDAAASRLRQHAGDAVAAPARAAVEDCVQSLDLLHAALGEERSKLRRLKLELRQTHAALAAAQAGLATAQESERQARHLSQHDSLTELPNRSQFRRRLDDALDASAARPPALAVLFMDLDNFKPINDHHGHDAGDGLLRVVAQRLRGAVRAEDVLCRLGGDEFACLLSQPMAREQLGRLAGQLVDAVSAPLTVGTMPISMRPSTGFGLALYPIDGDTTATVLQRADAAMYRATRGGQGYTFFDGRALDGAGAAGSSP